MIVTIARQLAISIERTRLYTETRRAYQDLRNTQEQLLQSEKMSALGRMISGVAHELNNPLTAILGYAQLLEEEGLNERARDFLAKLYKQVQRTQKIVHNLLSFARQQKPFKSKIDLAHVLEETLLLREPDLKLHNILVERSIQPVPSVVADANQLEQVFINIINNAADAILEGSRGGNWKSVFSKIAGVRASNSTIQARESLISAAFSIPSIPPRNWAKAPAWDFRSATAS